MGVAKWGKRGRLPQLGKRNKEKYQNYCGFVINILNASRQTSIGVQEEKKRISDFD